MTYPIYRILYKIALPDPDMPQPRYHNILFVETNPVARSGTMHEVSGVITCGMSYASSPDRPNPESDEMFFRKELIGVVGVEEYPDAFESVLRGIPPPKRQKAFNVRTMRTEQIRPEGGLYGEGEERPRMAKCAEWTVEGAIPALVAAGGC